jgi:ATP-dependent Clp protease adaptor protein ClpS
MATPTLDPVSKTIKKEYPNYRVIVLNDDVNTFDHVVESLVRVLPGMGEKKAWKIAIHIHTTGSAVVWSGPQEQAEFYHSQLSSLGLTMAPLEKEG